MRMFTAEIIGICFISMFAWVGLLYLLGKRRMIKSAKAVVGIGVAVSIYCMLAGVFLLSGWQDPLASVDPSTVVSASSTHGGKGGIIVLAISLLDLVE
jgi:hypothetical protein